MIAPRFVVTGPPNCGKSTWCQQEAIHGDIVWDFDAIASVLTNKGDERPRGADESRGPWPWPAMKATLVMRDALVKWLSECEMSSTRVYMIVRDPIEAQHIARLVHAELVVWSKDKWA